MEMQMAMSDERRLKRNAYMRDWKRRQRAKVNSWNKQWKDANRDQVRASARAYSAKRYAESENKGLEDRKRWPQGYLCAHARTRSKALSVPFNLVPADIEIPDICPVLGIVLEWGSGKRGAQNSHGPSLDRIVPTLGYVKGNVKVISNRANRLKNDGTPEELRLVAEYSARETARVLSG